MAGGKESFLSSNGIGFGRHEATDPDARRHRSPAASDVPDARFENLADAIADAVRDIFPSFREELRILVSETPATFATARFDLLFVFGDGDGGGGGGNDAAVRVMIGGADGVRELRRPLAVGEAPAFVVRLVARHIAVRGNRRLAFADFLAARGAAELDHIGRGVRQLGEGAL